MRSLGVVLILVLLNLIALQSARADVHSLYTCPQILAGGVHTPHTRAFDEESLAPQSPTRRETVRFVEGQLIPFELGGHLRVIEAQDGQWHSLHATSKNALAGDPRWIVYLLGPEVAYKLGFRLIGENRMTVPNAEAVTAAIVHINRGLRARNQEEIPIRYFETDLAHPLSGIEFLQQFLRGFIPLERGGALGVHDATFHIASLLLPPVIFRELRSSANYALDFSNYLRQHMHENPERFERRRSLLSFRDIDRRILGRVPTEEIANRLIDTTNHTIDLLGNLTVYMVAWDSAASRNELMSQGRDPSREFDRSIADVGLSQDPVEFVHHMLIREIHAPPSVITLFEEFRLAHPPPADAELDAAAIFTRIAQVRRAILDN